MRNNTSGYKGVTRATHGLKWQAGTSKQVNGKHTFVYLGKSDNLIEAAKMYDKGVLKLHGKRAFLNFPTERST